jgi:MFS family permease
MLAAALRKYRDAYAGLPREVWLLSLAIFVNRCGTMVMPFLTLYLTSELEMNDAAAGRLISVYGVGSVCGAYASGRWCDRIGPLRLQTACLLLAAPCYLLIGAWNSWPPIAANLFVLSFLNEAVRPASATAIARLTTSANRTRAFALQRLAANLGFSFGPAIGGVLAQANFQLLFWVDAGTTLVAGIALWRFFGFGRYGEAANAPVAHHGAAASTAPLRDRTFVAFLLLTLATMTVFMQFGSTYPLYLRDHFRLSEPQIGLMFAVNTSIIVGFEMLLMDAVKGWPLLGTIGWGSAIACLGFGILPLGATGLYAVFAMAVVTIGEMLSFPLSSAYVTSRGGARMSSYNGWHTMTHSLAAIIGPAAGGALYGVNHDWPWIAGLVVAGVVLVGYQQLASRSQETCENVEPTQPTGVPLAEVALEQPAEAR